MANKTPDDELELFAFAEDHVSAGKEQSKQPSKKSASFDFGDWEDTDPDQVDAIFSALNGAGNGKASTDMSAAWAKTPKGQGNQAETYQVGSVVNALKDLKQELLAKAMGGSRRAGQGDGETDEAMTAQHTGYKPVWETRREKEKEQLAREKEKEKLAPTLERVSPAIGRELRSDQMLVYDSELDELDYIDEDDVPEMRDYMPIAFRRYGRTGIGNGVLYALFVISISIVLAVASWMMAMDVMALNKESSSAVVVIDAYEPSEDDTLNDDGEALDDDGNVIQVDIDQVATALKNAGIIEYKWLFKLYSHFSNAQCKIDPGTYYVSTELDYHALVTNMQFGSGSQETVTVTFPEGYTISQIFELLEENNVCKVSELEEAAANYDFDYDFLDGLELGDASRLEGYLFPDTYEFYQGESATVAINRFLRNANNKLTEEMESQASALGYSMHEIIIIASLIEKEAGSDSERTLMASVIYNRLNAGWTLSLDSTINYILGTSTFSLTAADLQVDSPYNTYLYAGLPAGPICNPGLASIQAALNPDSTSYWYWYSYETSSGVWETEFFSTSDAFNSFAAAHPYS